MTIQGTVETILAKRNGGCDCFKYVRMHDFSDVCVNYEKHGGKPCAHDYDAVRANGVEVVS